MSQIIITTDISTIRPMFSQGASENIKRYGQLKKLFEENKEYTVLAEPKEVSGKKIAWHTEFEGKTKPFSKLSEVEQERAKGILKYQVNKLYKTALKFSVQKKENINELFDVLDSCIEIPDFNDIYVVGSGEMQKFVIIRWGFTSDDFDAQTGLIKKLIPVKVSDVIFKTVYTNDKSVGKQKVYFDFPNNSFDTVSSDAGKIEFTDLPLFTKFSAYQLDKTGKKINEKSYVCDDRDVYLFRVGTPVQGMEIYLTHKFGNYISNAEITLTYEGNTVTKTTDKLGKINLEKVPVGTEIICSQEGGNKQQITCKTGQKDYRIIGKPPIKNMEYIVESGHGKKVPFAHFFFEFEGIKTERVSDEEGNIVLNNMPVGINVVCYQMINNKRVNEYKYNCEKKSGQYKIFGESPVTTGRMVFKLIDQFDNIIQNNPLSFEYADMMFEKTTDEQGLVIVENVPFGTTVKVAQIVAGKQKQTISYTCIKNKNEYLIKGSIRVVSPKVEPKMFTMSFKVKTIHDKILSDYDIIAEINGERKIFKTDQNGELIIPNNQIGKKIVTTVNYQNEKYEDEFICNDNQKHEIIVGKKKFPIWLWLIPLLLLIILGLYFLKPYFAGLFVPTVTDTVTVFDTVKTDSSKVIPVYTEGLTLKILDEKTETSVVNAKVKIITNDTLIGTTDVNGLVNFSSIKSGTITAVVTADNFNITKATFNYIKEKIIYLSNSDKTQDVSEIPVPCGNETSSGGFGTTITVYKMGKSEGKFALYYSMYQLPDQLNIYAGKPSEISPDRMLWSTNGPVSGSKGLFIKFTSPDSLITVKVTGTDNKTKWVYKVQCPR